jgi:hypothetical protein
MTAPRSKSEVLSETAKSYLKELAKEDFYGYSDELDNKYLTKGREVEAEAIELLNILNFTNYEKNTTRKSNDFLTGECDIYTPELIIDIKSSWSLKTFPATVDDINIKDYEWQLRGYMYLYDVPTSFLTYCMVDTPENLIGWENETLHKVSHIEPRFRVTSIEIKRDLELEQKMIETLPLAIEFYSEYINNLNNK